MSTASALPRPGPTILTDTAPSPVGASPRPLRVLVVDDNADTADTLVLLLSVWGYSPSVAYGGLARLAAATAFRAGLPLTPGSARTHL
jgi:hypothetical protein